MSLQTNSKKELLIEYFYRSHMKTRQDYWINAQSAHLAHRGYCSLSHGWIIRAIDSRSQKSRWAIRDSRVYAVWSAIIEMIGSPLLFSPFRLFSPHRHTYSLAFSHSRCIYLASSSFLKTRHESRLLWLCIKKTYHHTHSQRFMYIMLKKNIENTDTYRCMYVFFRTLIHYTLTYARVRIYIRILHQFI